MSEDPRLHIIAITGIVHRNGKFLILQRSKTEKAFPEFWTVPGGKIVRHEYENLPKSLGVDFPQWYGIVDKTLRKEIREEAGIDVDSVRYLTDLVFIRPDNIPALVLSYWCKYESGEVKLGKDMTNHAWVTLDEAKKYNLIPGIWNELEEVNKLIEAQTKRD